MTVVATIEHALRSGALLEDLTFLPKSGASLEALGAVEATVGRGLSTTHRDILSKWNGANLDIVRVCGTGETEDGLPRIEEYVDLMLELGISGAVAFANDPAGFTYLELQDGSVAQYDHDGGGVSVIASDVTDFIENCVFGRRADQHFGDDWLEELRSAGLVQA